MPAHTIATNAGLEGAVVVGELLKVDKPEMGHNAATAEYCDMIAAGIIDPTKVMHAWALSPSPSHGECEDVKCFTGRDLLIFTFQTPRLGFSIQSSPPD